MEPIVSPWIFYALQILDTVNQLSVAMSVLFGSSFFVVTIVVSFFYLDPSLMYAQKESENEITKKQRGFLVNFLKKLSWCFATAVIVFTFIPTKETAIQMLVAKNTTTNNIESVVNSGKNIKDEIKKDIIDIVLKIKEEKVKEK